MFEVADDASLSYLFSMRNTRSSSGHSSHGLSISHSHCSVEVTSLRGFVLRPGLVEHAHLIQGQPSMVRNTTTGQLTLRDEMMEEYMWPTAIGEARI